MNEKTTIIICRDRSAQPARRAVEQELLAALANWPNVETAILPHLYDLAPEGPGIRYLQSLAGPMIVLASLYPRTAHWVLDANRVQGRMGRTSFSDEGEAEPASTAQAPQRTIWCLDVRPQRNATPLLEEIRRIVEPVAAADRGEEAAAGKEACLEEDTRYRWYPVIDYDRCQNCLECLNFCLFGVFGVDESEQLIVEQPDACRDGCPACSRVCPAQAIMFPHHNSPAVAGDTSASTDGFNLNLVQLFDQFNPQQLAAAERELAVTETESAEQGEKDDLDRLVDDLDQMEL